MLSIVIAIIWLSCFYFPTFAYSEDEGCLGFFKENIALKIFLDQAAKRYRPIDILQTSYNYCEYMTIIKDDMNDWYLIDANLDYSGAQKDALHALQSIGFLTNIAGKFVIVHRFFQIKRHIFY